MGFVLVALGLMVFKPLYPLAAICGLALFWRGIEPLKQKRLASFLFFAAVQGVEQEWLLRFDYHGLYILFVFLLIICLTATPFALLPFERLKGVKGALALAGFWTLWEVGLQRLIGCGFSLNQLGLILGRDLYSAQFASVAGVLGLSFYTLMANVLFYQKKHFAILVGLTLFPYVFGCVNLNILDKKVKAGQSAKVALIQTGLRAEEKRPLGRLGNFISPYVQWGSILSYLKDAEDLDLIVLPEVALPFSAHRKIYSYDKVCQIWHTAFQKTPMGLESPYAHNVQGTYFVSNAYLAKALAEEFGAEVVIGLADKEYNAAFHFKPGRHGFERYEKQILLPLAESLPIKVLKPLAERYGVGGSLKAGNGPKVFSSPLQLTPSICYEDMLSHIIWESRKEGGLLFVNVTNDVWYPNSTLPGKHYAQARLRAIENGVPLIRACNTGVTTALDALGRSSGYFENREWGRGALILTVPLFNYHTLYFFWGDTLIVLISIFFLINYSDLGIILRNKKYQLKRWTHLPKTLR